MGEGDLFDNGGMRALSIRQPYAELILRGIKTAEYRSRRTGIIGERFLIYASKGRGVGGEGRGIVGENVGMAGGMPGWMRELAEQVAMIEPDFEKLARGLRSCRRV